MASGLPAHVESHISQYSQILLLRATLKPFSIQPVYVLETAPTQMQDLALGLCIFYLFIVAMFKL